MRASFRQLWRQIFRRSRLERDLDDELRAYVDLLAEEKIRAGLPPDAARRAALVESGGIEPVKDEVRDARALAFVDRLRQDVGYGLRLVVRAPGLNAAIVLTLALGIGATSATFSVVDAVLLRPLAYADADRLVVVMHEIDQPVSPANYLDWRRLAAAFSSMAAAEYWTPSLPGVDGSQEKVYGLRVSPELFPTLGVAPALGRYLSAGPGGAREVVIGHGLWQRLFAADTAALGREVTLDGLSYRLVGVMPPGFKFAPFWATRAELWAPLDLTGRTVSRRSNSLRVFARLAPGVSLEQARSDMTAVAADLEARHPGTNRDVTVTPLAELVVGDVRTAIVVLFAAVSLVLLVACANVAHMLLARASARRKEIALRAALGAGRLRIVRQLLTESLLLAAAGGTAGAALAGAAIGLVRTLGASSVPRIGTAALDERAVGFTVLVSLGAALVFGLAPALRLSQPDLTAALRDTERGSTMSRRSRRLRLALIASEVALAVVLLVGAGLLMRSFAALRRVDPGFRPDGLVSMVVSVTGTAEAAADRRLSFYQRVRDDLTALPGVDRVGAINHTPLTGDIWGVPFAIDGRPPAAPGDELTAAYRVVLPGYFEAMGLPLIAGRDLTDADRAGAAPVAVVNEFLAETYWPGQDPIGKRIRVEYERGADWRTVVGVAKNAVRSWWRDRPAEEVYVPLLQNRPYRLRDEPHLTYFSYVIRTTGDPAEIVPAARRTIQSISPAVPVSEVSVMRDVVAEATTGERFMVVLLGSFAAMGLALAAIGIYGVMSCIVAERRREIGVRLALGARPGRLTASVVGQGLIVAAVGAATGLASAALARGVLSGLVFGITPLDAPTFAGSAVVLAFVGMLASYLPARRACRTDALKQLQS